MGLIPLEIASPRSFGLAPKARARLLTGLTYFRPFVSILFMAIFDVFKKHKERERFEKKEKLKAETADKEKKTGALEEASSVVAKNGKNKATIIPRVTEKSTVLNEAGAYVFNIPQKANKVLMAQEIKKLYGVSPVKVNIINSPGKKVFVRGKHGVKTGFKKAIVYLKKGEKINIS